MELWDLKHERLLGIYDRTFFRVEGLRITDAKASSNGVYLLDYDSGIFTLDLRFN